MSDRPIDRARRRRQEGLRRSREAKKKQGKDTSRIDAELGDKEGSSSSGGGSSNSGSSRRRATSGRYAGRKAYVDQSGVIRYEGTTAYKEADYQRATQSGTTGKSGLPQAPEKQTQRAQVAETTKASIDTPRQRATSQAQQIATRRQEANTVIQERAAAIQQREQASEKRYQEQLSRFGLQGLNIDEDDGTGRQIAKGLGQAGFAVSLGFVNTAERIALTADKALFRAQLEYYDATDRLSKNQQKGLQEERAASIDAAARSVSIIAPDKETGQWGINPQGVVTQVSAGTLAGVRAARSQVKATQPKTSTTSSTRVGGIIGKKAAKTTRTNVRGGQRITKTVRTGAGKIKTTVTKRNLPRNQGQVTTQASLQVQPKGPAATMKGAKAYPKGFGSQRVPKSSGDSYYILRRGTVQKQQGLKPPKAPQNPKPRPINNRPTGQQSAQTVIQQTKQQQKQAPPGQRGVPNPREASARSRLARRIADRREEIARQTQQQTPKPPGTKAPRQLIKNLEKTQQKPKVKPTTRGVTEIDTDISLIPPATTAYPLLIPTTSPTTTQAEKSLPALSESSASVVGFKQDQTPSQTQDQQPALRSETTPIQQTRPEKASRKRTRGRIPPPSPPPPGPKTPPSKKLEIRPPDPIPPPPRRTIGKEKEKPKIPIIPPTIPIRPERERPRKQRFFASIRREGVFKKLPQPFAAAQQAFNFGIGKLKDTAAASLRVEDDSGSQVDPRRFGVPSGFRLKGSTLIQRRERRISSAGEKKDITAKGLATIRAKKSIFRP